MRKLIYLLVFVFSTSGLYAQKEIEEIKSYCQNFEYQELIDGLEKLKRSETKKINYRWDIILERELVNDYFEQVIEFNTDYIEEDKMTILDGYQLKIKLLKNKIGKIAYYSIVKMKFLESEVYPLEAIFQVDSNITLTKIKNSFFDTYSKELNFKELFNERIKYGRKCSSDGSGPEARSEYNELIKSKDTSSLLKWLKSGTVEIQLYAIEGILRLQKLGITFDKKDLDLVEVIASKEGTALFCSGCSTMNDLISDTVKRIKKEFK